MASEVRWVLWSCLLVLLASACAMPIVKLSSDEISSLNQETGITWGYFDKESIGLIVRDSFGVPHMQTDLKESAIDGVLLQFVPTDSGESYTCRIDGEGLVPFSISMPDGKYRLTVKFSAGGRSDKFSILEPLTCRVGEASYIGDLYIGLIDSTSYALCDDGNFAQRRSEFMRANSVEAFQVVRRSLATLDFGEYGGSEKVRAGWSGIVGMDGLLGIPAYRLELANLGFGFGATGAFVPSLGVGISVGQVTGVGYEALDI